MKTIIAAAVAAFSINAHAFFGVPDEVAHCVDLRNNVAINAMELGERTKCYAEAQGTTSGVRGNFVWVRTGDKYTYIPMQEVREQGTREKVQELITTRVVETVVNEELQAQLDAANAEKDAVMADLAEARINLREASTRITALNNQISTLNTQIADFDVTSNDAEVIANALDAARRRATAGYTLDTTGNTRADFDAANGDVVQGSYTTEQITGENYGSATAYYNSGALFGVVPPSPGTPPRTTYYVGGAGVSQDAYNSVLTAVNGAIQDAVDDAYKAGYADGYDTGYDAGYNSGYADGFADGVNSVR